MKKYLILCVSLALISLTSCNESFEELDDVQQTAEQKIREELDDALSALSEIYDRSVVVVEMPTADNSETIAKVEEAMKSIGDDKKEERYVVVSINDVFVSDLVDELSLMSQQTENLTPGSHTFKTTKYPFLPCDLRIKWDNYGIYAEGGAGYDCILRYVYVFNFSSGTNIDGRVTLLGYGGGTYNFSGFTNDDNTWTIQNSYYYSAYMSDNDNI